jgi:hypothetical protein
LSTFQRWLRIGRQPAGGAGFGHHSSVASVTFTSQLRRFTETPEVQTAAETLRDALSSAFEINPRLRGYVLDDQSHLRANVVVFIDGVRVRDRESLADALHCDSRVHVLQALSGG